MRTAVIVPALLSFVLCPVHRVSAQDQQVEVTSAPIPQRLDARFRIVPTQNIWNVLLLDTSTGRVWQVQYALSDTTLAGRWAINLEALVPAADTKSGRFTLYATHNTFNFILLDQDTGRAWQIQWSLNAKNRGIIHDLGGVTVTPDGGTLRSSLTSA